MRKRKARKTIEKYRQLMSVQDWGLEVQFGRDEEDYSAIHPQHQYRRAELKMDLEMIKTDKTRTMGEFTRHELAHLILARLGALATQAIGDNVEMQKAWEDAEDEVATHIARMAVWTRRGD